MKVEEKIAILQNRLNQLSANPEDNAGVQRKIRREIRDLEKTLQNDTGR